MRTRRFLWVMRTTAWITMFSTGGLALAAPVAQARQLAERNEAMKPKPVNELAPGLTQSLTPEQWAKVDAQRAKERATKAANKPAVRVLSDKEMAGLHGRGPLRNKYLLGTLPWQRSLRDANLCTGNLFKSFTDIQVSPAKGAGLALQRTYNSNDDRPGPFGVGWTHAYDIRMEEAQSDPVKDYDADPTTTYMDANFANRADFFGHKHRYHRDADGLYTPPAYLFDELNSNYKAFLAGDPIVQASVNSDDQHSMDGTVKHFELVGSERVCKSITDRYGNQTVLAYNTATLNGTAKALLDTVTDPSGRQLTFRWHDFVPTPGAGQDHALRIVQVDGPQYSVVYDYYTDTTDTNKSNNLYNLKSVTLDAANPSAYVSTGVVGGQTPRTTQFAYGDSGGEYGLLARITDPQGLMANEPTGGHTVSYTYQTANTPTSSVWVATITEAAGYNSTQAAAVPHTWHITPSAGYDSSQQLYIVTAFADIATNNGNFNVEYVGGAVVSDGQLRAYGLGPTSAPDATSLYWLFYRQYYDSANNVQSTQDVADGNEAIENAHGFRVDNFTYGPHGNQLTHWTNYDGSYDTQNLLHKDLTYYYPASGYFQKKQVKDANGRLTTFGLDTQGNVTSVQDADYNTLNTPSYHRQYLYSYDGFGRKTDETDLNGVATHYEYGGTTDATNSAGTPVGNLTQVTRDYNVAGTRLNLKTKMAYDVVGHVLESLDPKGNKSDFQYNNLGQPTSAMFYAPNNATAQETILYQYGVNGRTEKVTDGRGDTTMTYEPGGDRVLSVSDPTSGSVAYQYAVTGERTQMTLPNGAIWTYQYASGDFGSRGNTFAKDDPNSVSRRLASVSMGNLSDGKTQRVDYRSNALGHLFEADFNQTFQDNTNAQRVSYCETDYEYDHETDNINPGSAASHWWLANIKNVWHNDSVPDVTLVSNTYSYYDPSSGNFDYAGNRHTNTIHSDATYHADGTVDIPAINRTETYQYDNLYRLAVVDYGDGQHQGTSLSTDPGYSFDAMGNRKTKSDNTTGNETYSYDNLNRLTNRTVTSNGATNSQNYTFDKDGNTQTDGVRTNVWDAQNRLSQCSTATQGVTTFTYGADGLRRQKSNVAPNTTTPVVTDSILDNGMLVQERLHGGNSLATYMVGLRGPECRRDDQTSIMRWYLYDGLGSVLGEVAPTGAVVSSRKLDVYGLARSTSIAVGETPSKQAFVGSLGHTTDAETGNLVYMRARYMDTATGRFISQDPSRNGNNWFAYCNNNPVNHIDADGKKPSGLPGKGSDTDNAQDKIQDAVMGFMFLALAALYLVSYAIMDGSKGALIFSIALAFGGGLLIADALRDMPEGLGKEGVKDFLGIIAGVAAELKFEQPKPCVWLVSGYIATQAAYYAVCEVYLATM